MLTNKRKEHYMSLDDIHNASLELLAYFHETCEKHNISYFLAYGTLLGCIRHNGFIPWDDDIDVWMMREDYDRFVSAYSQRDYYDGRFKLVCRDSDSKYSLYIARLSDMRYKYCPTTSVDCPDMGTFIDIYPLDSMAGQEPLNEMFKKIEKWNRLYDFYCNPSSPSKIKGLVKKVVQQLIRTRYGENFREVVEIKTKNILAKDNNNQRDFLGVPTWYTTGSRVYPKKLFAEKELHKFEGLQLFIPKEYDQILKMTYGDYMTPPVEKQRTQYHEYNMMVRKISQER